MLPNLSNHVDFPPFSIGTYPMELFMVVTTSNSESVVSTFKCLMIPTPYQHTFSYFWFTLKGLKVHDISNFCTRIEGIKGAWYFEFLNYKIHILQFMK